MNHFEKMIVIICLIITIVSFLAMMITIALSDPNCIYIVGGAVIVAVPAFIVFGVINSWYDNGSEGKK
jgi:hypothetical protein